MELCALGFALASAQGASLLSDELGELLVAQLAAALFDELAGHRGHGNGITLARSLGGADELVLHAVGVHSTLGDRSQEVLVGPLIGSGCGDFGDLARAAVLRFVTGSPG